MLFSITVFWKSRDITCHISMGVESMEKMDSNLTRLVIRYVYNPSNGTGFRCTYIHTTIIHWDTVNGHVSGNPHLAFIHQLPNELFHSLILHSKEKKTKRREIPWISITVVKKSSSKRELLQLMWILLINNTLICQQKWIEINDRVCVTNHHVSFRKDNSLDVYTL